MADIESRIDELIEEGHGRPTIMEMVPGATEWQIRKRIKAKKKKKTILTKNAPNKEVVSSIKKIVINSPKFKKNKPKNSKGDTTVVFVGDTHSEFIDERAFDIACQIIDDQDVDILVHLGDLLDFYSLSSFDKDPKRRIGIQEELNLGAKHLSVLNQVSNENTRRILVQGNHEVRLERYIKNNAPAFHDLDVLRLENLLSLDDLGWEFVDYDLELFDNFLVKHGERVSKHSGYSAKREMEEAWMSGISGHTHRAGMHFFTSRRNYIKNQAPNIWIENACLCELDPEYVNGNANWQHGFTIITYTSSGDLIPQFVHIVNGRAVFNGKVYS